MGKYIGWSSAFVKNRKLREYTAWQLSRRLNKTLQMRLQGWRCQFQTLYYEKYLNMWMTHPHRISVFSLTPSIKTELIRFRLLDWKSVTLIKKKKKLKVMMLILMSGGKKQEETRQNSLLAHVFIDLNLCTRLQNCYDNWTMVVFQICR